MRNILLVTSFVLMAASAYCLWLVKVQFVPNSTLVTQSIDLGSSDKQSIAVKTNALTKLRYDIDVLLLQAFDRNKMKRIVGDNVSGDRGQLQIQWQLHQGNELITQGNSKEYRLTTIFGGHGEWGLTIGNLMLLPDTEYMLDIRVAEGNESWQQASPKLQLNLSQNTVSRLEIIKKRFYMACIGSLLLAFMLLAFRMGIQKREEQQAA